LNPKVEEGEEEEEKKDETNKKLKSQKLVNLKLFVFNFSFHTF
jgi:hypothetical protein